MKVFGSQTYTLEVTELSRMFSVSCSRPFQSECLLPLIIHVHIVISLVLYIMLVSI